MYTKSKSFVNATLYMNSGIDSGALAVSALPLTLQEFPLLTGFSTIDPSPSAAALNSIESNNKLIKEELKNRIQFKRMAEGKEELPVGSTEKPKAELTDLEKEKVDRRRVQNRIAARRFREKQNTLGTTLQKKMQNLESYNTSLRSQIKELRKERDILERQIQEHLSVCLYVTDPCMQLSVTSAGADLRECGIL